MRTQRHEDQPAITDPIRKEAEAGSYYFTRPPSQSYPNPQRETPYYLQSKEQREK